MNNKKAKIMSVIASLVLAIFVIGATYSYFAVQGGDQSNADIRVVAATIDLLTFKMGDAINLELTQDNFASGSGDLKDSTTATATFTASNSVDIEKSSARYNVYLLIESNGFQYTTADATPEVIFKITDPNGKEIENVTGLVHTENGFDITTRTGGFLLAADYYIEATRGNTVSQEWNLEVTFVNLDADQTANAGKSLSGKIFLTAEQLSNYELPQISSIESETTSNSISAYLNVAEGTSEIDKYYYAIEKASSDVTGYLETNNNSVNLPTNVNNYMNAKSKIIKLASSSTKYNETDTLYYNFANLQSETTYKIYAYAVDKKNFKSNLYETEVKTTSAYKYAKINYIISLPELNSITLSVNAAAGDNEIVKYFYSKDNGKTYEESTSSTHVFSNLLDSTTYQIKIKVLDSAGNYSSEYYKPVTTEVYVLPTVTTVASSQTFNEINLTTTAQPGKNAVSKYYYSIDNGEYVLGSSNYTFSNLEENSTHLIKVKVEDNAGKVSNEYNLNVTTNEYVLPTITSIIADTTSERNSITIDVETQKGDGNIVEYYYSKDGGSNYVKSTESSYTFSNLTGNTKFYLKVYAKDNNGKSSNEYIFSAITSGEVFISNITSIGKTNGAYETNKSEYTNDTASMFVTMPANSSISYEISISNLSNNDYTLSELKSLINSNSNLTYIIDTEVTDIYESNLVKKAKIIISNNSNEDISDNVLLKFKFALAKSTIIAGIDFNAKIKKLAGNTIYSYNETDTLIKKIVRSSTLDINPSSENVVSTSTSSVPIYAWYDNGTIYYYSKFKDLQMNKESQYMFSNLENVESIDLSTIKTSHVENMQGMFSYNGASALDLSSFDTSNVINMSNMFQYSSASSLNLTNFDTSNVTKMSSMFYGSKAASLDLSNFDTSNVTTMSNMFDHNKATSINVSSFDTSKVISMSNIFNESCAETLDLRSFDTSNITSMENMFRLSGASLIDVSSFDTSKVTSMGSMFSGSLATEIRGLSNFNTSKVTDMSYMFFNTKAIALDVSNFDTSNVTNMSNMFQISMATSLNLSNFNTSKVTKMSSMFYGSEATTLDLSSFNTSNVTSMGNMFDHSKATSINISSFNTSNVTNMGNMFNESCAETLDLRNFDTSKVTSMSNMFRLSSASLIDVSSFDTSKVTSMGSMFYGSLATEIKGLSNFNTSKVTDMSYMFLSVKTTTLDLSNFNTSNVTNMSYMFHNTKAISINVSSFDTSKVTNMASMFYASEATTLDLSSFNTSKVTNMGSMFEACKARIIDISNFDTSNVTKMSNMFRATANLTTIYAGNNYSTASVTNSTGMFSLAFNLVGGNGTKYNENNVDKTYARIDTADNPGYFTLK